MIQLDDVCFAYDDRPILSHLTETIEPGQAVLLSGPNGSGSLSLSWGLRAPGNRRSCAC